MVNFAERIDLKLRQNAGTCREHQADIVPIRIARAAIRGDLGNFDSVVRPCPKRTLKHTYSK